MYDLLFLAEYSNQGAHKDREYSSDPVILSKN